MSSKKPGASSPWSPASKRARASDTSSPEPTRFCNCFCALAKAAGDPNLFRKLLLNCLPIPMPVLRGSSVAVLPPIIPIINWAESESGYLFLPMRSPIVASPVAIVSTAKVWNGSLSATSPEPLKNLFIFVDVCKGPIFGTCRAASAGAIKVNASPSPIIRPSWNSGDFSGVPMFPNTSSVGPSNPTLDSICFAKPSGKSLTCAPKNLLSSRNPPEGIGPGCASSPGVGGAIIWFKIALTACPGKSSTSRNAEFIPER